MNKKEKNKSRFAGLKSILLQLCLAVLIVVLLLVGLRLWLNHVTQHGVEIEVPQITGLSLTEAQILLSNSGLEIQVTDSTYSHKVPLGTIVEQDPLPQSMAKAGRAVYVVVNAKQRRQVVMPDMIDISYRQAEYTLRQLGLVVSEVQYEPSAYRDLVLDVRKDDVSLPAGSKVEEGSSVVLVVGMGLGEANVIVPDLKGRTLIEARSQLLSCRLTIGTFAYDVEPEEGTEQNYVIYMQSPAAGESLKEGMGVNVWLSTDLEKAATADNVSSEEDFF